MRAVKTIFIGLILSFFIFFIPSFIFAQTPPKGLESCFQYYDYGKINVHLSAEKSEYKTGESVKLKGQIINNNTFPLTDLILYAQVRRINEKTSGENGHYLIDKFIVKQDLSFLQNETKNIDVNLLLKPTYPDGSYQIQYYVFSKNSFHYGGRAFLEQDYAGSTNFDIVGGKKADVYFDIDNVVVNGQKHILLGPADEFPKGTVKFDVHLIDNRSSKTSLPVTIKFYSFEDDLEDKLVTKTNSIIEEGKDTLNFEFNPPEQGAYVLVAEITSPQQTLLKYRFAAVSDRASELRMNDLGVSSFPANNNGRAWVCFHSPSFENAPNTTVNLSVLNNNKKVIEQVSMTDSFDSDVHAISVPLTKLTTLNDFWVAAQFINPDDSKHSRSIEIHYDCNAFGDSLRTFDIIHRPENPYLLRVEGKNNCGQLVTKGKINNLRIIQNTTVKLEKTNIMSMPYELSLETLQPGKYSAQVKIGAIKKDLTFIIPNNAPKNILPVSKKLNISSIYFGIVGFIIILIILLLIYNRSNK